MNDIVVNNVLDAIHYVLEHNEFKFTDKQISNADEAIIPYINELDIDEKEFEIKIPGAPKLVYDKRIYPILVRYFAIIEDNIALYNELMEENYLFYEGHNIKFYALDKMITSKFRKNEFKNILLKNESALSKFYYSLRGLDRNEKEKYSKDFSDIVHSDHTTLNVGNYDKYGVDNHSFLVKKNFEFFGKEFLLGLSHEQREIINNLHISLNEESALKIKELLTKYPLYEGLIPLTDSLLYYFSVDEINSMSEKDAVLYEIAIQNNLLDRMKNILSINPLFDCPKTFIREEIFRILSDSEIVNLSDEAKEEIINIKIPEIDNVLVMPVRKVRRVLLFDEVRKFKNTKIESIKGNIKK